MRHLILKKLVKQYFKAFNIHSTDQLSKLFSKNIQLRDWDVNLKGINNVLLHNKKIFSNNKKIHVKIKDLSFNKKTVFAELLIQINKNKNINVIDIISYNDKNLIKSIKAFIG